MELLKENIIGELVALDYRAASVFKKHGIDFCCQGNRTIEEACNKKNIDGQIVVNELKAALQKKEQGSTDFQSWPLDLLTEYIEKKHHRYVEDKMLEIRPFLNKVCNVHGPQHPELYKINELFTEGCGELAQHMKKEELVLFSYIRKTVKAKRENSSLDQPAFGTVQNPIKMMMHEHEVEGERFRTIAELSNNYTPPADGCNTYRVTFALLQEFEEDLHLHIHLENNILFPGAIKLEEEFSNA